MNIWEIQKELGFRKIITNKSKCGYEYKGVFTTGNFTCIGDYGIGLLTLTITNPVKNEYPSVIVTTIDDGVWQGYGNKQINIDEIISEFEKNFGVQLPSENEFNVFLNSYGIHGAYTG